MAQHRERVRILAVAGGEDLDLRAVGERQAQVLRRAVASRTSTACSASFGPIARAASSPVAPSGSSSSLPSGSVTFTPERLLPVSAQAGGTSHDRREEPAHGVRIDDHRWRRPSSSS